MSRLIFYPADFNIASITKYVEDEIDTLEILGNPYKVFNYNYASVEEQELGPAPNLTSRSYGRTLKVVLEFIKDYVSKNTDKKFYIYLFTDGYSNNYHDININEYILDNIIEFKYIVKENEHNLGKLDFNKDWLLNKKFIFENI